MSDESQSTESKTSRKRGLGEQKHRLAREASYTRQDAEAVRAEMAEANGVARVSDEAVILEMQSRAREADAEAARLKRARAYDDIDDEDSSDSETYSESVGDDDFIDSDDEDDDESEDESEESSSSSSNSDEPEISEEAKESDDDESQSAEVDGDFVSAAAYTKQEAPRRTGRQTVYNKGVGEHDAILSAVHGNWKALEAFVEQKQMSSPVQTGAPLDEKRKEDYQTIIAAANAGILKLRGNQSGALEPCRMCGTIKPCAFNVEIADELVGYAGSHCAQRIKFIIRAGKFVPSARAKVEGEPENTKYTCLRHLMDRFTDDYAQLLDGDVSSGEE